MRLIVVLLLAMAGAAFADMEPPGIVMEGLDYYYRYGAKSAIDTWTKGSPGLQTAFSEGLASYEQLYGKVVGFEKIRAVPVCPSFLRVYALIKYENGPGFVAFDCYHPEADGHRWIVSAVNFNPLLPERLIP